MFEFMAVIQVVLQCTLLWCNFPDKHSLKLYCSWECGSNYAYAPRIYLITFHQVIKGSDVKKSAIISKTEALK